MTLAAQQAKNEKELIYRFRIEVGHRIDTDTWVQADAPNTDCYSIAHAEGKPSKVREYLKASDTIAEYTERASLALCQANASSWFFDTATNALYVHTSSGAAPDSGDFLVESHFWEAFCDRQLSAPYEITYDGKWCPAILDHDSIPDVSLEVTPFSDGGIKQSFGSIALFNGDKYFDSRLADYIYEAAQAILEVGSPGDADAAYTTIWWGWTGQTEYDDETVIINFEDPRKIAE